MRQPRLAWAITGSGHYIEACLELVLTLKEVDLYISQAGEEVLKMYGIDLKKLSQTHAVYRDKARSAPPVGLFYKNYYHTFIMAPTTSNTIAKCVLGIADSLVTNLYAQAGKCRIQSIVYPCDIAPEMETTAPSGTFMVYPRKIELEATEKIRTFEYTTVVESVDELAEKINFRLNLLQG